MNETFLDETFSRDRGRLATPKARVGFIIPSSNRLAEPQLQRFAPTDLGIHVARLQMTGKWQKPLARLTEDIERAASQLADAKPDIIVFNCTGTSMREGPEGNARIVEAIHRSTGIEAFSTAGAVGEALEALDVRKLVLVSPYQQQVNDEEIQYLDQSGFTVLHNIALGYSASDDFITIPPERWVSVVENNTRVEADGYFLSCTNTTQIETIGVLERRLGKPVVNSNQSVLWACLRRLTPILGRRTVPGLGRLFDVL
jgi:maleate cis-trans isomerase